MTASTRLRSTTTHADTASGKTGYQSVAEMTVDLTITPQDVSISNVRQILFAGGKWVGNYISPEPRCRRLQGSFDAGGPTRGITACRRRRH